MKKGKKIYQKYTHKGSQGQVKARLSEEKYKGILAQYDEHSVKCIYCDAILHPSTTSIQRHVVTPKHEKNMALKKTDRNHDQSHNSNRYSTVEPLYANYREPIRKSLLLVVVLLPILLIISLIIQLKQLKMRSRFSWIQIWYLNC